MLIRDFEQTEQKLLAKQKLHNAQRHEKKKKKHKYIYLYTIL